MYEEYEYDDILCHHGVKGQKWGVIRSARQLGHDISSKAKARKVSSVAKKKEDLIRSGDPDKILKNRKLFSDDEVDRILVRIQKMKAVESYGPQKVKKVERQPQQKPQQQQQQQQQVPKPTKSMTQQLDSAAKVLKTVAGMYGSYSVISKAVNTMAGKEVLPNPTKALKSFGKSGKGDSDTSEKNSSKKEEKAATKTETDSSSSNKETKSNNETGGSKQTTTSSQSKRSAFDSSDYSDLYSGKNTTSAQWEEVTDAFKTAFNSMPKNDSTVDMFFDAATGSYKAGTGESTSSGSWTQKMNVPVSGWLNSSNLPDIIR